jgi:hypothetical protein
MAADTVAPLLAAALDYATAGIPVLPVHTPLADGRCSCRDPGCGSVGKHPRLWRGVHAASTDPALIRRWWTRWPTANIGLRTGLRLDVCDIDGLPAGRRLTGLLGPGSGGGPLAVTGRGWHLWFAATGAPSRASVLPGVDWRGRNAIIVAPPSLHAVGVRYRWLRDHRHPVPHCPPSLRALIVPERDSGPEPARAVTHPGPYAQAALAAETLRVRTARAPMAGRGGNRNDMLNRAAFNLGQLVGGGWLDPHTATVELAAAARDVGLPRAEARRTIVSGLTAGQRHPRVRPLAG